jgi:hypothetical protein
MRDSNPATEAMKDDDMSETATRKLSTSGKRAVSEHELRNSKGISGLLKMQGNLNTQEHQVVLDKEQLLKLSEISLWLDSYDDIFSDFDPRPYSQRALSDDFLTETKKASRDKASGSIQLSFLVPKDKRNTQHENLIKKRLRDHFKKHYILFQKEIYKQVREGAIYLIAGIILMFSCSYIFFKNPNESLFLSFLITFLEPAGWFLFWQGLMLVIFESRVKKPDMEYYEKMTTSEIVFISY